MRPTYSITGLLIVTAFVAVTIAAVRESGRPEPEPPDFHVRLLPYGNEPDHAAAIQADVPDRILALRKTISDIPDVFRTAVAGLRYREELQSIDVSEGMEYIEFDVGVGDPPTTHHIRLEEESNHVYAGSIPDPSAGQPTPIVLDLNTATSGDQSGEPGIAPTHEWCGVLPSQNHSPVLGEFRRSAN